MAGHRDISLVAIGIQTENVGQEDQERPMHHYHSRGESHKGIEVKLRPPGKVEAPWKELLS